MKKLLSIALLASLGFSAGFTVMPYGSYINYSNSTKDYGSLGGIYTSIYKFPFKTEIDGEFLKLKYKNGTSDYYQKDLKLKYKNGTPDYYQKDLTFAEHYYIGNNYEIHGGIHNIFINQANNPNHYQKVFFGGVLYYKYLKYNTGIDYYYSDYRGFNVQQITPKIGFRFGNYYSFEGSFYTQAQVNYIHISDKVKAGASDDNYWNTDLKLVNSKGPWATTLKVSLGDNAYKVANGGFVVYNLGEKYKYSAGLDISYYINKKSSVKVGYTRSKFEENNKNAYSNVYLASYALSF